MRLFRACLVSLASASIDLPRDWQAQHCRGTHLEQTGETVVALAPDASRGFLPSFVLRSIGETFAYCVPGSRVAAARPAYLVPNLLLRVPPRR